MLSHFGGGGGGGKEAASVKMKVCQNNNHWDNCRKRFIPLCTRVFMSTFDEICDDYSD